MNFDGVTQQVPSSDSVASKSKVLDHILLVWLCMVQFMIYLDRGTVAGVLDVMQELYKIDHTHTGLLGSLFVGGYMISCPIFGYLSHYVHRMTLIFFGLAVWTFANFLAGYGPDFRTMIISRILTGVGEAAFCTLSVPLTNDLAPENHKARWVSTVTLFIVVGNAIGFIYGEKVVEWTGNLALAFRFEAYLMVPLVLFTLLPIIRLRVTSVEIAQRVAEGKSGGLSALADQLTDSEPKPTFFKDLFYLLTNLTYVFTILGYAAFNFTFGSIGYWCNIFVRDRFNLDSEQAVFTTGSIALISGLTGPIVGGMIQDKKLEKESDHSRLQSTLIALTNAKYAASIACVFIVSAVMIPAYYIFFIMFTIGETVAFTLWAFLPIAILGSVKNDLKNIAFGVGVFGIHLFGDIFAPYIIGWLADRYDFVLAMAVAGMYLSIAATFWYVGSRRLAGILKESH